MPLRPADVVVDQHTLAEHPLPNPSAETKKDERGVVAMIASSVEMPGAAILAGTAALRGGAGKLQIVAPHTVASAIAIAVPEARVVGVASCDAEIDPAELGRCAELLRGADAVLIGTGTLDTKRAPELVVEVLRHLDDHTTLILDAAALAVFESQGDAVTPVATRTIAMPNVVEAAHMLRVSPDAVQHDLAGALDDLIARTEVFVTLRDATTWSGGRDAARFVDRSGHPALATSGSGDVLAGLLCALAARGADPLAAMLWAVHAHGHAGIQAAQRVGGIGVLARELVNELPSVLTALSRADGATRADVSVMETARLRHRVLTVIAACEPVTNLASTFASADELTFPFQPLRAASSCADAGTAL